MVVGTGVEGQEDLLETGFAALEIEDLVPRQRLEDGVDRPREGDPEPVPERDALAYAWRTGASAPARVIRSRSPNATTSRTPGTCSNAGAGTGDAIRTSIILSALPFRSAISSTAARRPSRMMPTRSHTCSTSGITWDDRKTVPRRSRVSWRTRENSLC